MKGMKKATKESLLARAAALSDKPQYQEYYCETLGEVLMVKKLPLSRVCEIMDGVEEESITASMELNVQLIYESIPLFREKELQDAYGCVEPYDIVAKVFDDNMGEIQKLCEAIVSMYGMKEEIERLKN